MSEIDTLTQEKEDKKKRIKKRKLLEKNQEVVFRVIDKALRTRALSHAYLFVGPEGCLKEEMAQLVAQSIFCESDGVIREEELEDEKGEIARRVANGSYGDHLVIDGYRKSQISKEEVGMIQELFSKTTIEKSDYKVYVLKHIENTSIQAMNSLLKFLEEPTENVYAILTTDNIERILPTIVSRCVTVPFHSLSESVYKSLMEEEGIDPEDIYLLSRSIHLLDGFGDFVASDVYQIAKTMFKQYIGVENNKDLLLVDYDVRYRINPKDITGDDKTGTARDMNMDILKLFFTFLINYYKDMIQCPKEVPSWYYNSIESEHSLYPNKTYEKHIDTLIEQRDRCNRNNDLNLLLAQTIYRLEAF